MRTITLSLLLSFHVASYAQENAPASFFEDAPGRQKISFIGGDIIKRFNIIIDAQRTFVYIRPNKVSKSPYSG